MSLLDAVSLPRKNPMGSAMMGTLVCQFIVLGLAIPGAIVVDHHPASLVAPVVGGVALLTLGAAGMLRRSKVGYLLGWIAQPLSILLGLLTPLMYVMGGMFALIWTLAFAGGRKIQHKQATQNG